MKKILWILFSGLIPLCILLCALFLFDPLQIFHRFYFGKPYFSNNMSYQAAGIINTFDFDSAILGSSLMTNTSSYEASKKLEGLWVNLSINGGTIPKRNMILRHILLKKSLKQVIFSIEPAQLVVGDSDRRNNLESISYLYDLNLLNDIQAYLNNYFISCLIAYPICLRGEQTYDRPAALQKKWQNSLNMGGLKNNLLEKIPKTKAIFSPPPNYSSLLQTIKENPQTTFFIIIPPLSRVFYKFYITQLENITKDFLNLHLSNVKVFGFDNTSIPDNLSQYVDLTHYDEKVNSFMLDAIKNDTHRITLENVDSYFEEMRKKVEAYDIEPLRKQIIESRVLSN